MQRAVALPFRTMARRAGGVELATVLLIAAHGFRRGFGSESAHVDGNGVDRLVIELHGHGLHFHAGDIGRLGAPELGTEVLELAFQIPRFHACDLGRPDGRIAIALSAVTNRAEAVVHGRGRGNRIRRGRIRGGQTGGRRISSAGSGGKGSGASYQHQSNS